MFSSWSDISFIELSIFFASSEANPIALPSAIISGESKVIAIITGPKYAINLLKPIPSADVEAFSFICAFSDFEYLSTSFPFTSTCSSRTSVISLKPSLMP